MNKKLALRTFIAACIGVLGGIAPLAVTADYLASTRHAVVEVVAVTQQAHFTGEKADAGRVAASIALL